MTPAAHGDDLPTKRRTAMAAWHPDCYQRATAFVTDPAGRLLVFEHLDVDAGTQVPGGGIPAIGEPREEEPHE